MRAEAFLCFTNRAQCHLKLKQYQHAKRDGDMAVKMDETNVKARFRRGVACCGGLPPWVPGAPVASAAIHPSSPPHLPSPLATSHTLLSPSSSYPLSLSTHNTSLLPPPLLNQPLPPPAPLPGGPAGCSQGALGRRASRTRATFGGARTAAADAGGAARRVPRG